ncbi:unnamed protein product [Adineta ricciae]|uniref:Uncharacterized protein n=1 Tax=Adineta ricciae TaxID=249248 RepID=A0A813R636_ADIRI|nr:unnamed protein product [Adineta ricciae]CAF1066014.1 unnamed protein product [Adineta ricciae]
MLPELETPSTFDSSCCRLVRTDRSSRLILPLARRGRPYHPDRSQRLLCKTCSSIKHAQQREILQRQRNPSEQSTANIFNTISDLDRPSGTDISHEIEFSLADKDDNIHLNQNEYEPAQMLIWKMSPSDHRTITLDDTGCLNDNEKKVLLQEAIAKLRFVLNNRSAAGAAATTTATISQNDLDQIEFTYRALQTTVNILSPSLDSL